MENELHADVLRYKAGAAEYYMQHNYRELYGLLQNIFQLAENAAKETRTWYTEKEMYNHLRLKGYSHEIAEELSSDYAANLQGAYQKGLQHAEQPDAATAYATKMQEVQADNDRLKIALENVYRIHGHQWSEYDRNVIKDLITPEKGGLSPTEPILDDDDVKALLPPDLNLAVIGHGKPERAVTGPVWVKAVDRLPDGAGRITWRWLDKEAAYIGFDGTAFVYDKGGARVDMLYAIEIEWLDESGTAYNELQARYEQDIADGKELSAYYAHLEAKDLQKLAISLRVKGDRLLSILRSLRLSVTAHPDYTGQPNAEWTDLVNASDEAIMNWLEKEVKP